MRAPAPLLSAFIGLQGRTRRCSSSRDDVYLCRHVDGTPESRDPETDAAAYFSLDELNRLTEPMEPWSDWLVRRVFDGNFTLTSSDPSNPLYHDDTYLQR